MDVEEFRRVGKEMVDFLCEYTKNVENHRVTPSINPGYLKPLIPSTAPENPEPWTNIMKDIETKILPGITHWNHPHFHAYFPAGNSFPSVLGDMLSDVIGGIGFSWASCPAVTELEAIVLDWLGQAIGLPDIFLASKTNYTSGGVILGSASECTFTSLLAARAEVIKQLKGPYPEFDGSVYLSKLTAYCSREAHSSVEKACRIVQIKLRILDTDNTLSLRGPTLEEAIQKDIEKGYMPFWVCATLGSTASAAFDNLYEIGHVCQKYSSIWLHVDAAYAGSGFICPELRKFLRGIEHADSIMLNPNKWLLTNFDCSCMWIKDCKRMTRAMAINADYYPVENSPDAIDYRHWGIPLSRRFRSLKLWFVLRSYGITGLQKYIRNHIKLAKKFESLVKSDDRFEVLNRVDLGLVCFRLKATDRVNEQLLATINYTGDLHMIPARIYKKYIIRFCVVYEHATEEHIEFAWKIIRQCADVILPSRKNETPDKTPTTPPLHHHVLKRRLSFVRSVSREQYQKVKTSNNLSDGASLLIVADDEDEEHHFPVGSLEDEVFHMEQAETNGVKDLTKKISELTTNGVEKNGPIE